MTRKKNAAPESRFVGPGAFCKVRLAFPVEFEGKVYEEITVRRMNVRELREYVERAAEDPNAMPDILDCPMGLMDALFPDDEDAVGEAINNFLPQRLKGLVEPAPESGATTAESSPPSSTSPSETSSISSGTTSSTGI
jgi:hypothetical protein